MENCYFKINNGCSCTTFKTCPVKCNFFKTNVEFIAGLQKTFEKIREKDTIEQKHIADTYYKGRMPWNE